MSVKTICAVIVTFNAGSSIRECVNSLRGQVGKILVVDNGSNSETIAEINKLEGELRIAVIYNRDNRGVAAALNEGAHFALDNGYRWMLSLDHDSQVTVGMVDKLVQTFSILDDKTAIVSATPVDRNIGLSPKLPVVRNLDERIAEVRTAFSSGSLLDVRIFNTVGFFNETLFMYYVDDDFCMRARERGFGIYLRRDAILCHAEGAKRRREFLWLGVNDDGYGPTARYYISRNAIFMLRQYYWDCHYCYHVIGRLISDGIKACFFVENRSSIIRSMFRGLSDGMRGRYGPMGLPASYALEGRVRPDACD